MNLNKYHSSGRLYTQDEAFARADALLRPTYAVPGYRRDIDDGTGLPRIESKVRPFTDPEKQHAKALKLVRRLGRRS